MSLREYIQSDISNNNSQETTNKDQDNSQTEQQVQKEARTEENRSIAWAPHGHIGKSLDPQENTTSSKELIGRQLHLETESSCDSNLLRRMTDDKKHR